ncbi:hypothetical protein BG011_007336 [Mortierella polycephala]|uniref:MIT domain-containing protein n=1 Tax=Mortierella polycephala TaxID=41804 RepID=A0A9P6TXV5_9FUNG|nr:hypothetical protein BG011_007336 [Mortierella polycephala]
MEETAVNLAHRYANAAEEYLDTNQWHQAVDMHLQAADQFLLATKDTQNQEVIQTLKLMNANHTRQGKDLQRRIAKAEATAQAQAQAQAVAADASSSAPQQRQSSTRSKSDDSTKLGSTTATTSSGRRRDNSWHQQAESGSPNQRHSKQPTFRDLGSEVQSKGDTESNGSYHATSSEASSNSSSAMVEGSFTLVKDHLKDDSNDPFNKFWDAVENLVLKISSPVAFTSIPLDGDDPMQLNSASGLLHSPTSEDAPPLSPIEPPFSVPTGPSRADNAQKVLQGSTNYSSQPNRIRPDPSPMQESFFIIDSTSVKNSQLRHPTRNRSISTSESTASSSPSATASKAMSTGVRKTGIVSRSSTKTLEEYAIENEHLKLTLDKLSRRNLKLEKHLEGVMQMSVWTKDVQRSAMQLIKSQDVLRPVKQSIQDLAAEKAGALVQRTQTVASTTTAPSAGTTTAYDQMNPTTMQARLKELEEELQKQKLENAKQNALMKKYKQRWEDLKESAKRRRNATPTPQDGSGDRSDVASADPRPHAHRPLLQSASSSLGGTNPFANSSLAAGIPGGGGGSSSNNSSMARPLSNLARSPSTPGRIIIGSSNAKSTAAQRPSSLSSTATS